MIAITLHIYDKETGEYLYQDSGIPSDIIRDIGDDKDFTTVAPPSYDKKYYWRDAQWVANDN